MENNKKAPEEQNDNSLNANEKNSSSADKAASLDAIITSPTEKVKAHTSSGNLGSTGTNVSYEGPTAPGGGGSVGTGYGSGQSATGSGIEEEAEKDAASVSGNKQDTAHTDEADNETDDREKKDTDTLGNP